MKALLEYSWGYKYGTLNHDTPANTIYLTRKLRRSFEDGLWALLPVDGVLLRTFTCAEFNVEKPVETMYDHEDTFEYCLVPLPGMHGVITRVNEQGSSRTSHDFPYTTLLTIRLQLQPHYVALDFANKMMAHNLRGPNRFCGGHESYFRKYGLACRYSSCLRMIWLRMRVPLEFIRGSRDDPSNGASLYTRPGAIVFLPEDPTTIWNDDQVGLGPSDSVTDDEESDGSSDDEDEDKDEYQESNSTFNSRMMHWVDGIGPPETMYPEAQSEQEPSAIPDLVPSSDNCSDVSDEESSPVVAPVMDVDFTNNSTTEEVADLDFVEAMRPPHRMRTLSAMSVDPPTFAHSC
ncbi:hypothetical protein H0H92_006323 [Tricholoma furcatifolium]|nr:hypothetical protein H0H92_006323 [Tricholoma furcatifolium]